MPKVWTLQSNFTSGELDPKMLGRTDIAAYYQACRRARDVTPIVQGGLKRRAGTQFVDKFDTETIIRLYAFEFSTEEVYLLAFSDNRMYIYKDGVTLQTNISGSGNDYLTIPYNGEDLNALDIIQSADTMIIVHPDYEPRKIVRTSDTAWTISTLGLTNIPQFDFNDASSPTPTSEVQTITFTNQNTSDRYRLGLEGILTEDIIFSNNQTTNAESIQIALQALPSTANSGISVSATSISVYVVTFAGDSAKDWGLLTGTPVNTELATFEVSSVRNIAGVSRSEDVWGSSRGWPQSATFHEGRLWFGGSPSRPSTLWGSVVNDFFNFDSGRARDDELVDVTLDTDQVNSIQSLFSNRALQIFTTGQEFYVPTSPITPENISVVPQTNFGTKKVRPITIDGRTIIIQRTGKAIREFVQSDSVSNIYNSSSISLLASHLVVNPIKMAALRGDTQVDANYAYFVNSDGTLLVYNVLGAEGIIGFTLWAIEGYEFWDVVVIDNQLFGLLSDNSDTFIVKFDQDRVTDFSVYKNNPVSGTFDELDHLEGQTVAIINDGSYQGEAVVSGGSVTVETGFSFTEVGLPFIPVVETMPLNIPMQNGPNFSEPKKINRVTVDYFESMGIIVKNSSGQRARIANKTMGSDVFSNPTPQTGRSDIWLLGWDNVATVTITQEEPVPMTILSLAVEVGVQ